jgi:hypothetical protein
VALAIALAAAPARVLFAQGEQPKVFLALATGFQETPAVDTGASAFGRFVLSADKMKLSYRVHVFGLKGNFTAMHLHRGRAGEAGPVVYPLSAPTNGVATGEVNFNPTDETDLTTQGLYLNIHSEPFPGGEVRGQVVLSPDPSIGEPPTAPEVSFAKDIQPIFTRNCSCHTGRAPEQGMNLEPGKAFASIVNVRAVDLARLNPASRRLDRIEPGDPAKSYMIHKLNNTQRSVGGTGLRMPLGGRLPDAQIALITTWVAQGAKNN